MIRNYLKIALRNILRDKYHAGINVFGLGIGMACAMLVILYASRELSYDKDFADHERVYRISTRFFGIGDFAGGSPVLASQMRLQPWVEASTRVIPMGPSTAKYEQTKLRVAHTSMADSAFFRIFNYPFVEGDPATALTGPGAVVISKEIAGKLFGDTPATGKLITFDGQETEFQVTGVFDDSGILSHLKTDVLMSNNEVNHSNPWWNVGPHTYVKVNKSISEQDMASNMKRFVKETVFPAVVPEGDMEFEEWYASESGYRFFVFPLSDIYFEGKLKFEAFSGGDFANLVIFSVVGVLIVLIAGFNFINLSTARAIRRATEVGIRKTLGSGRFQLVSQFMLESMVITIMATILALGLTELLIMVINSFVGAVLPLGVFSDKWMVLLLLAFAFLVGALSAVYPSFYLTGFSPSRAMRGANSARSPGVLRNVLVVAQFTISIALIIGSIIIYRQLDFVRSKDLGFDQKNSVIVKNLYAVPSQETLREEVLGISGVLGVSLTDRTPGDQSNSVFSIVEDGKHMNFEHISTDPELVPILDLMMIAGRNFDPRRKADTAAVIMNQQAVELAGLKDPVGKKFDERYEVIGVVSDFHFQSMKNQIAPLLLFNKGHLLNLMVVKLDKNAPVQQVLQDIENLWVKHNPEASFEYSFLDENYARIMEKDERLARAIGLLTSVAVVLSLLGLTGLCSYTVERKTKEIGIRKVLGASWQNIVMLLSRQFVRLVIIAFVVAAPGAWYFADMWLAEFAYHIKPGIWMFVAGAALAVIPTWILISLQSITAARTNPVDSLRDE